MRGLIIGLVLLVIIFLGYALYVAWNVVITNSEQEELIEIIEEQNGILEIMPDNIYEDFGDCGKC